MKRNLKKLMAAGMTALLVLSTAACGSKGGGETAQADTSQTNFKIFAGVSALSPDE